MGAVRMLAGLEIRRRIGRIIVVTLLVGVVGAVVLSSIAGARRSESALDRFNASSRSSQLEISVGTPTAAQLEAFSRVEGVESYAPLIGGAMMIPDAPQLQAIAEAVDTRFGDAVDRARVVAGRAANPNAVDEVTIGEALAAQLHLRLGDHLDGRSFSPEQIARLLANASAAGQPTPDGPEFRVRVVGIVRRPLDLGDRGASGGVLVLTPAFTHEYQGRIGSWDGTILRVRTRRGAPDVAPVAAAAHRIFGQSSRFKVQDLAIESQGAQSAIDAVSVALWVFGGVAAAAGLVAIAIVLSREISMTAAARTTLRALGVTRAQRIAVGGLQAVPVAVGGALVAVIGAAAVSPLFPVGVAKRAEPSPGVRVDSAVLALGAVAVVVGIAVIAFLAAFRASRPTGAELAPLTSRTSISGAASRARLSPAATTGVRMALDSGRGRSAVPVRSAVFAVIFGAVGVASVLMVTTSLDHLAVTPARYGWTWDFAFVPDDHRLVEPASPVSRVAGLDAAAEVDSIGIQLDGRPVTAWSWRSIRGRIDPEIVAGRLPSGRDEIALGSATLTELHKRLGDRVQATGNAGSHDYRIVGQAVFAKIDVPQPLANGAFFTGDGLEAVVNFEASGSAYIVGRAAFGSRLADVKRQVAAIPYVEPPIGPTVPVEVDRLRQVNWLPGALAALLSALALVAVGHALVTSVRRRRGELAVLKALGFDGRQIRAAIRWQATTLATVGLFIGLPLGLLVGSLVWRLIANGLGIATTPVIPVSGLLALVAAALVAVNAIAFFPARSAARARPAEALRSA